MLPIYQDLVIGGMVYFDKYYLSTRATKVDTHKYSEGVAYYGVMSVNNGSVMYAILGGCGIVGVDTQKLRPIISIPLNSCILTLRWKVPRWYGLRLPYHAEITQIH